MSSFRKVVVAAAAALTLTLGATPRVLADHRAHYHVYWKACDDTVWRLDAVTARKELAREKALSWDYHRFEVIVIKKVGDRRVAAWTASDGRIKRLNLGGAKGVPGGAPKTMPGGGRKGSTGRPPKVAPGNPPKPGPSGSNKMTKPILNPPR